MSEVTILMEMGFPKERAEYALKVTQYKGVEPAMEWLLAHTDEEIPASAASTSESTGGVAVGAASEAEKVEAASSSASGGEAKSIKCDVCNKVFKDASEAEFHAVKTNHANFSESTDEKKPLTEEEKKAQLALIEEKLKQKRIEREQREKAEELEREKNRIKSGKGMTEARRAMEEMEMKKIVEQRKREKLEEKAARERVKAQIEADKAVRKAREQGLDASAIAAAAEPTSTVPSSTSPSSSKTAPKEYTETRIQIRLQDGTSLQETFNVKEQLSAVRLYIQMKTNVDFPFRLITSFPRKVFTEEDYDKPLDALGLVPSAVIIMTK